MGTPYIAPDSTLGPDSIIDKGYLDANATQSTTIRTIVTLSQAAYDALGSKDANTLYIII